VTALDKLRDEIVGGIAEAWMSSARSLDVSALAAALDRFAAAARAAYDAGTPACADCAAPIADADPAPFVALCEECKVKRAERQDAEGGR